MANYGTLGLACVFAAVGLLLIAISFATDSWIDVTVDREDLAIIAGGPSPNANSINISMAQDPAYFSRNRGLFRTCYDIQDISGGIFLDAVREEDLTDGNCIIERGYEVDGESQRVTDNDDYDIRIHLMRAHFAFFVVAMILVIVGVVCGSIGCWKYSTKALRIAAFTCIAAFLFTCGGMAFFHGYEYLEEEKINTPEFPKYYLQTELLADNSKFQYGYSYILGWLGAICVLVGGILYVCVAWSIRAEKRDKKQPFDDAQPQVFAQPMYQQPQMVMAPQPQMVAAAPSMYGGYAQQAAPVAYAPAPSMIQGYGY